MKKRLLIASAVIASVISLTMIAQNQEEGQRLKPLFVQGIDYYETLTPEQRVKKAPMMRSGGILEPGTELVYDGDFTFDMIENWSGTGSKSAALVIQWNTGSDESALVFGYHWDGVATGFDMLQAVVENNTQLFALCQATNVGCEISPIAPGGYTVCGIGWDVEKTGDVSIHDATNTYVEESGFYIHPRGWDPVTQSGSIDYDYDNWGPEDATALWQAGWYSGYWSYWCKDSDTAQFSYSGWGIACRELEDGSWDGWNFSPNLSAPAWKPFVAAPANLPEGTKTRFVNNGICYSLKNYILKTVEVVAPAAGMSYEGDIVIPETFVDEGITYTVVSVDNEAFAGAEITDVTLPAGVNKIGNGAFQGSTITSINLTDNVTSIGNKCFAGCYMLSSAYIPASLTKIPDYCFMGTAIENITFPENIETIGEGAYSYCPALTEVTFGATVKEIGAEAFAGCDALQTMTSLGMTPPMADATSFDADNAATLKVLPGFESSYQQAAGWSNFNTITSAALPVVTGDYFIVNKVPYHVLDADSRTVEVSYYPIDGNDSPSDSQIRSSNSSKSTSDVDAVITSTVTYKGVAFNVASIRPKAFAGAQFNSVVISDGIDIPDGFNLFFRAGVKSVVLPSQITKIDNRMFYLCQSLSSVTIPSSVRTIGDYSFYGCMALEGITLPNGLETIGTNAFEMCSVLKEMELPSTVVSIGEYCFNKCGALESINFPTGLTSIPRQCFVECKNLKGEIDLSNVTFIGDHTFRASGISGVKLSDNLTYLGYNCFAECDNLTEFVIPASVTCICNNILYFSKNAKIYSLIEDPANCDIMDDAFNINAINDKHPVTVLSGLKAAYDTAWSGNTIVEPVGTVNYGDATLSYNRGEIVMEAPVSFNCATELPSQFAKANNERLFGGITAVLYGKTNAGDNMDSGTTSYEDGIARAVFRNIADGQQVRCKWRVIYDGSLVSSSYVYLDIPAWTMPEALAVDFAKIDNWAEQENYARQAAFVIRWNDCVEGNSSYQCPLDNLVMGVKFTYTNSTMSEVMRLAGDQNRRLNINSDFSQITFDMTGKGAVLTSYDHNKSNTASYKWNFWKLSGSKLMYVSDLSNTYVKNGDVIIADYQPADAPEPTVLPDMFYLPSDDKIGVFMPETTTFTLRDNCHLFVPYFVNVGPGGSYKITTKSEDYNDYVTSAPMVVNQSSGCTTLRSHMNLVTGKTGSFPLSVTATINGTEYTASTQVKVVAPLKPVTAITLSETEPIVINGYPNRNAASLTYTIDPADATYTKVAWSTTDNLVATVSSGKVSAGGKQGSCEVRLTYAANPEVYGAVEVQQALNQLVEEIRFGDDSGVFNLEYMDILLVAPTLLPENADNKNFSYEIIGDPEIATTYTTKDIINHKPGTVQVKISALDGSDVSKTVTVNFAEPDRTPLKDQYQDGIFWLNEEWFTHTNGSINYLDKKGDNIHYRVYESQNPYECFGATSCSAVIYGDRIYVSSKQPHDNGDTRQGGGRLVIFDAKTLNKLAAFRDIDAIGGDGRTVVGVNPEKVYVATNAGIKVLTVNNEENTFTLADSYIAGTVGGSLYAGQIGDMVCADGYVFAVKQSTGIYVIDTKTDQLVATIPETGAVALCRSYDGDVWCASTSKLYHIDTENLTFDQTYTFPSTFPQSWSAWRPSNLFASKNENVLYWGHSAGWNAGCDWIYRWEIGSDFPTTPIFNSPFPTYPGGTTPNKAYAGGGYDSRTNTLLVASCSGAGTSARYNHINFIDGTTGELKKSVPMKDYFWFPSHPVFPDKYAPEIGSALDKISTRNLNQPVEIDLSKVAEDKDHPFSWINWEVEAEGVPYEESNAGEIFATATVSDGVLTVTPSVAGKGTVSLKAESNGKVTTCEVPLYAGAVVLNDGVDYERTETLENVSIDYVRDFAHAEWQALYLPFDIDFDDIRDFVEVAQFVDVRQGADNSVSLEFEKLTGGDILKAHTPYLVRPFEAGRIVFSCDGTDLEGVPSEETSVSFTFDNTVFTLAGTYKAINNIGGSYALHNGSFKKGASPDQVLKPYRIYLTVTSPLGASKFNSFAVNVDGQVTSVEGVAIDNGNDEEVYDLNGLRIRNSSKGIVIKKGEKTLIR